MFFQKTLLFFAQAEKVIDKEYPPITLERGIIWAAVVMSLIAIALYAVNFFRGSALGKIEETSNHLDEFRRLRDEGMLDEEEYSQVKSSIVQHNPEQVDFREDTSDDAENNSQS